MLKKNVLCLILIYEFECFSLFKNLSCPPCYWNTYKKLWLYWDHQGKVNLLHDPWGVVSSLWFHWEWLEVYMEMSCDTFTTGVNIVRCGKARIFAYLFCQLWTRNPFTFKKIHSSSPKWSHLNVYDSVHSPAALEHLKGSISTHFL